MLLSTWREGSRRPAGRPRSPPPVRRCWTPLKVFALPATRRRTLALPDASPVVRPTLGCTLQRLPMGPHTAPPGWPCTHPPCLQGVPRRSGCSRGQEQSYGCARFRPSATGLTGDPHAPRSAFCGIGRPTTTDITVGYLSFFKRPLGALRLHGIQYLPVDRPIQLFLHI